MDWNVQTGSVVYVKRSIWVHRWKVKLCKKKKKLFRITSEFSPFCASCSLFSAVTFKNKHTRLFLLTCGRAETWVITYNMTFMFFSSFRCFFTFMCFCLFFHWHDDGLLLVQRNKCCHVNTKPLCRIPPKRPAGSQQTFSEPLAPPSPDLSLSVSHHDIQNRKSPRMCDFKSASDKLLWNNELSTELSNNQKFIGVSCPDWPTKTW